MLARPSPSAALCPPWPRSPLTAGRWDDADGLRARGPDSRSSGGPGGPCSPRGPLAAGFCRSLEEKRQGEAPRHGDTSNEALVAGTLPARRAVATPHLEAACRSALSGGGLCGLTTARLKNVDSALTAKKLAQVLTSHGFKNSFDLVYIPLDMMNKTKNRSLAFVNFVCPAAAEGAYLKFHNQQLPSHLGVTRKGKRLEITPAYVQGFQDNVAWNHDAVVAGQSCILCLL